MYNEMSSKSITIDSIDNMIMLYTLWLSQLQNHFISGIKLFMYSIFATRDEL